MKRGGERLLSALFPNQQHQRRAREFTAKLKNPPEGPRHIEIERKQSDVNTDDCVVLQAPWPHQCHLHSFGPCHYANAGSSLAQQMANDCKGAQHFSRHSPGLFVRLPLDVGFSPDRAIVVASFFIAFDCLSALSRTHAARVVSSIPQMARQFRRTSASPFGDGCFSRSSRTVMGVFFWPGMRTSMQLIASECSDNVDFDYHLIVC